MYASLLTRQNRLKLGNTKHRTIDKEQAEGVVDLVEREWVDVQILVCEASTDIR
jgi:hypothetical protein